MLSSMVWPGVQLWNSITSSLITARYPVLEFCQAGSPVWSERAWKPYQPPSKAPNSASNCSRVSPKRSAS